MAELIEEVVCEEVIEDASIEELIVVAEVLGKGMDSGKAYETKENLTEETTENSNRTESREKVECFEFKIYTADT
ncbi:hypothetical protein Hanom_Chr03g00214551 [Helianthus anomalus]